MSTAHVRVEAKPVHPNASFEQKERAFRAMFSAFKRKVNDAGILTEYNERSTFESKGQKLRRKRKEAKNRRHGEQRRAEEGKNEREVPIKNKLREHFGNG
jgi:ribosomal protein S21